MKIKQRGWLVGAVRCHQAPKEQDHWQYATEGRGRCKIEEVQSMSWISVLQCTSYRKHYSTTGGELWRTLQHAPVTLPELSGQSVQLNAHGRLVKTSIFVGSIVDSNAASRTVMIERRVLRFEVHVVNCECAVGRQGRIEVCHANHVGTYNQVGAYTHKRGLTTFDWAYNHVGGYRSWWGLKYMKGLLTHYG